MELLCEGLPVVMSSEPVGVYGGICEGGKQERITIINTGVDEAADEDGGSVWGMGKGRSRLMFRRWKFANRVTLLM